VNTYTKASLITTLASIFSDFAPARVGTLQPKAFTDAQGWKPDAYGTSLQVGDVNHDGRGDLCGRSSAGLVCSTMP
jgi:hypothetical protein